MKQRVESDLRAPVGACVVGHRPRPRRPPPADLASRVRHRRRRSGVPPPLRRRDGGRPRPPSTASAPTALEPRLTPSLPARRIPAGGASTSTTSSRRCRSRGRRWRGGRGGRGVEERVGARVGVVVPVGGAGPGRRADGARAGAPRARGRVGAGGGGGGGGVVEGAARGGLERRRRHPRARRWLTELVQREARMEGNAKRMERREKSKSKWKLKLLIMAGGQRWVPCRVPG